MTEEELVKYLEFEGYECLRILPDGIVGVIQMLFTWGLCIDIDKICYVRRYCYETKEAAVTACLELTECYQLPRAGYKAVK